MLHVAQMKRLEKAKPMRLKEALNSGAISTNANHNIIAHLLVSGGWKGRIIQI